MAVAHLAPNFQEWQRIATGGTPHGKRARRYVQHSRSRLVIKQVIASLNDVLKGHDSLSYEPALLDCVTVWRRTLEEARRSVTEFGLPLPNSVCRYDWCGFAGRRASAACFKYLRTVSSVMVIPSPARSSTTSLGVVLFVALGS